VGSTAHSQQAERLKVTDCLNFHMASNSDKLVKIVIYKDSSSKRAVSGPTSVNIRSKAKKPLDTVLSLKQEGTEETKKLLTLLYL
jgi:hypothetical protein